jgi:uncharacterized iron-regulated protein
MIRDLSAADMVFFGEEHNNPIAHWMEREVMTSLYNVRGKELMMGAEMIEADNQLLLDEYLQDLIPVKKFEEEARLWKNYKTDYKPLVDFAHDSGLVFVADNIPRRYASLVAKKGFEGLEALSDEAKGYIHPLPIPYDPEVKCYKDMLSMKDMGSKVNENFPKAQAVKDATMAWFILKYWKEGKVFLHFNGSYHSDNHLGILWYVNKEKPGLKIRTLSVVSQEDPDKWDKENNGLADYIIVVPEDMTKTY